MSGTDRIVQAIIEFEIESMGLPSTYENINYISTLVNRVAIAPLVRYLEDVPSIPPKEVVNRFQGMLRQRWLSSTSPAPVQAAPPPPQAVADNDMQVEQPADTKPVSPVSGPRHTKILVGAGLFRSLNRKTSNHYLPDYPRYEAANIVHAIAPGSMVVSRSDGSQTDYRFMRLSGPVLNADVDCKTYLCLIRVLAQLSEDDYESAARDYITLPATEFYSPLRTVLTDREFEQYIYAYKEPSKVAASLDRLRNLALTLFEHEDDAQMINQNKPHRGNMLSVGLVSMIELMPSKDPAKEGMIRIRPNRELRDMYRAVNRLIAVNRATLLGLEHSMTTPLALWIASLSTGHYKGNWMIINRSFSVKDILEQIHPLTSSYYNPRYLQAFTRALVELNDRQLVKLAIKMKVAHTFTEVSHHDSNRLAVNSVHDQIKIIGHLLSHKSPPSALQPSSESAGDKTVKAKRAGKQIPPETMVIELQNTFKQITFHRLKKSKPEDFASQYRPLILKMSNTMALLLELDKRWLMKALKTVLPETRRGRMLTLFKTALPAKRWALLEGVITQAWEKPTLQLSERDMQLHRLIEELPMGTSIQNVRSWYADYKPQLHEILALVREENAAYVNGFHLQTIKSRLITPLSKLGMSKEANAIRRAFTKPRASSKMLATPV